MGMSKFKRDIKFTHSCLFKRQNSWIQILWEYQDLPGRRTKTSLMHKFVLNASHPWFRASSSPKLCFIDIFISRSFDEASPRVKRSRVASSSSFPITHKLQHNSSSPLPPSHHTTPSASNHSNISFDESQAKLPKVSDSKLRNQL